MSASTFGTVLLWVQNRLEEVEKKMNKPAKTQVSKAAASINALVKNIDNKGSELANQCSEFTEAEYQELIASIRRSGVRPTKDDVDAVVQMQKRFRQRKR